MEILVERVSETIRHDQCEDLLASAIAGRILALELPQQLQSGGMFGTESLLVHIVVTAARKSPKVDLAIPAQGEQARNYMARLAHTAYGLAALELLRPVSSSGEAFPPQFVSTLLAERLGEHDQLTKRVFLQEEGLGILSIYGHQNEFSYWPFSSSG